MIGRKNRGQSVFEYLVMVTIVLAAFLAIGNYAKRALQGRWKAAVDDLGDQYDPRVANSRVQYTVGSRTSTRVETMNSVDGYWTSRSDKTNSLETKTGYISVGAY